MSDNQAEKHSEIFYEEIQQVPYMRQAERVPQGFRAVQNLFQEFCASGAYPRCKKVELVEEAVTQQQATSGAAK